MELPADNTEIDDKLKIKQSQFEKKKKSWSLLTRPNHSGFFITLYIYFGGSGNSQWPVLAGRRTEVSGRRDR